MTVQQVTEAILRQVPVDLGPDTLDTLKTGEPGQVVRGIAVTFMATRAVLEEAVRLGANLIVTHEPTFYHGSDQTRWLEADGVFRSKRRWIDEHGLAIWRFHDGAHRLVPDAIVAGVSQRLGWEMDPELGRQEIFAVCPKSVREIARWCKQRLGISSVRVAGDLNMRCRRIGLLVGSCGGDRQVQTLCDESVDVLVCGESPEWQACEYVRDAAAGGSRKALIVLGHANSEEAGMEWVAGWLRGIIPAAVPIHYVSAGDPFSVV